MSNIEELIEKECKKFDICPEVLTSSEKEQLKKEILAKQKGEIFLDGILYSLDIIDRSHNYKKAKLKEQQ